MDLLIKFLVDNYIYFVFVAILLVLALIGYIVDTSNNNKKISKESSSKNPSVDMPVPIIDENIRLSESVNKVANDSNVSVKSNESPIHTDIPPIMTKKE